ncbi:MAG TPA: hypothetical protein DCE26_10085 [Dehalococcoidia bacterium]|nr:hypothetical protein [Dehalococcoidia bacterium]
MAHTTPSDPTQPFTSVQEAADTASRTAARELDHSARALTAAKAARETSAKEMEAIRTLWIDLALIRQELREPIELSWIKAS